MSLNHLYCAHVYVQPMYYGTMYVFFLMGLTLCIHNFCRYRYVYNFNKPVYGGMEAENLLTVRGTVNSDPQKDSS